jgi:hypothetical protein
MVEAMVIVIPSLIGFLVIDWNACDKSLFVQGFLPRSRFDTSDTSNLKCAGRVQRFLPGSYLDTINRCPPFQLFAVTYESQIILCL